MVAFAINKNLFKINYCSMGHFFSIRSYHFRQDFVHCFMSIVMICRQTGGYIYTLVSGEFHLAATCSQNKNRPEKLWQNWIVLAVRWSLKYVFTPNSSIFRNVSSREEEKQGKCKALCFTSKRNKGVPQNKAPGLWMTLEDPDQ